MVFHIAVLKLFITGVLYYNNPEDNNRIAIFL